MHVKSLRIKNFRRLKDVSVDLDSETTIFVGANNSGKTSATHILQLFLGDTKGAFALYDFSLECWAEFDSIGGARAPIGLPSIELAPTRGPSACPHS
jgi:predicted ATP-dependent endonuclease of OLD family